MHLSSFRVSNGKSLHDSRQVQLESGFNVIVGRNNVGKTALVQAMSLRFGDTPHRSLKTVREPGVQPAPESLVTVSIKVDEGQLANLLVRALPTFYVPSRIDAPQIGESWLTTILSEGAIVEATFRNGSVATSKGCAGLRRAASRDEASSGPIWLSVLSTVLGGTLFVISDLWGLLMEGADQESGP